MAEAKMYVTLIGPWISVNEELPEDQSDVLAWSTDRRKVVMAYYFHGTWYDYVKNCRLPHVTHWMPVPEFEVDDDLSETNN